MERNEVMTSKLTRAFTLLLAATLLLPSSWLVPDAAASETTTVYHETFASGKGAASQSGGAS